MKFKLDGMREIERALARLPRGTAKGLVRRVMKKELKPVADMANALSPFADDNAFKVTSRLDRRQVSDSGLLRGPSALNMFVGAVNKPEAHLIEWGTAPRRQMTTGRYTGQVAPQPMLTPAWEKHKRQILKNLAAQLWQEIQKTQARRAKRAAK